MQWLTSFLLITSLGLCTPYLVLAEEKTALPDPLTYDAAIAIADQPAHYEDLRLMAEASRVEAGKLAADNGQDLQFELNLLLQYVDPVVNPAGEIEDDHKLALVIRKQLYDGGVSTELEQSAEHKLKALKFLQQSLKLKRKLDITTHFFNVSLADKKFANLNEAIATAFVKFDKTKDKNELGLASDIDLYEADYKYNIVRADRYKSEVAQRITRTQLAETLARPDDLVSEVILPELPFIKNKRPELDVVLKQALANNLKLKAQRELVEATLGEVSAARNRGGITLSSELEIAENSRELISKNNWRAALSLNIPLNDTYSNQSKIKAAYANWQTEKARLLEFESDVRKQVVQYWQDIHVLQAELLAAEKRIEYRELYQDRSRGYYEMEYVTDLGDSFVELSAAQFNELDIKLKLAMAWLNLEVLTGKWHSGATQ